MTNEQKAFNATPEGQRAMCIDATSRSVVLILNRKVRQLGGDSAAWADSMIETANDVTLNAIRNDLIDVYNGLVKQLSHSQTT